MTFHNDKTSEIINQNIRITVTFKFDWQKDIKEINQPNNAAARTSS